MRTETGLVTTATRARFARVPSHVVQRAFVNEAVMLHLHTGAYHGLNPTGGHMVEVLDQTGSIAEAVARLAQEYGEPDELIEADLRRLCGELAERGADRATRAA